jgi:hypothetical protein
MRFIKKCGLLCLLAATSPFQAANAGHFMTAKEPIGVMGAHSHHEGGWMLSYRFMRMDMDGNRDGTDSVSTPLPGFMVSPLKMRMDMHMLGGMYGVSDELTVMVMAPVLDISMDHRVNMSGEAFTTEADGFGDAKVSGIYELSNDGKQSLLLNMGLSIPTGSIDEKDVTPATSGADVQLPYPMQLGSGTYDLLPGVTWLKNINGSQLGVQARATLRMGDNDNGYTLGDRYMLTSWYSHEVNQSFSSSVRVSAESWDNIDGTDDQLNPMAPMMVPTARTDLRAGKRVDLLVGVSWDTGGHLSGHRLAAEVGAPVYQDLDGPQLETDLVFALGWQGSF